MFVLTILLLLCTVGPSLQYGNDTTHIEPYYLNIKVRTRDSFLIQLQAFAYDNNDGSINDLVFYLTSLPLGGWLTQLNESEPFNQDYQVSDINGYIRFYPNDTNSTFNFDWYDSPYAYHDFSFKVCSPSAGICNENGYVNIVRYPVNQPPEPSNAFYTVPAGSYAEFPLEGTSFGETVITKVILCGWMGRGKLEILPFPPEVNQGKLVVVPPQPVLIEINKTTAPIELAPDVWLRYTPEFQFQSVDQIFFQDAINVNFRVEDSTGSQSWCQKVQLFVEPTNYVPQLYPQHFVVDYYNTMLRFLVYDRNVNDHPINVSVTSYPAEGFLYPYGYGDSISFLPYNISTILTPNNMMAWFEIEYRYPQVNLELARRDYADLWFGIVIDDGENIVNFNITLEFGDLEYSYPTIDPYYEVYADADQDAEMWFINSEETWEIVTVPVYGTLHQLDGDNTLMEVGSIASSSGFVFTPHLHDTAYDYSIEYDDFVVKNCINSESNICSYSQVQVYLSSTLPLSYWDQNITAKGNDYVYFPMEYFQVTVAEFYFDAPQFYFLDFDLGCGVRTCDNWDYLICDQQSCPSSYSSQYSGWVVFRPEDFVINNVYNFTWYAYVSHPEATRVEHGEWETATVLINYIPEPIPISLELVVEVTSDFIVIDLTNETNVDVSIQIFPSIGQLFQYEEPFSIENGTRMTFFNAFVSDIEGRIIYVPYPGPPVVVVPVKRELQSNTTFYDGFVIEVQYLDTLASSFSSALLDVDLNPKITSGQMTTRSITSGGVTTRSITSKGMTTKRLTTSVNVYGNTTIPEQVDNPPAPLPSSAVAAVATTLSILAAAFILMFIVALILYRKKKARRYQFADYKDDLDNNMELLAASTAATGSGVANRYGNFESANDGTAAVGGAAIVVVPASDRKYNIDANELVFGKVIGEGAYGQVFIGTWRMTPVAIKKVKGELPENTEAEFFREVNLMMGMKPHENVVAFFGVSLNPLCIVTEFCEHGSLDKLLASSENLNLQQSINWFKQIAAGMHHLSLERIVHKDLAARNILLGSDRVAKVADFGLSRVSEAVDNMIQSKSNVGPIKWMAPESIEERVFSVKSDVWSFGVTAIEILTRKPPFPNLSVIEYMTLFIQKDPSVSYAAVIPSFVPEEVKAIITPCFNFNPEDRPNFEEISGRLNSL